MMKTFVVSDRESGITLEKYVRKVLKEAPLSFIYKLFRKKDIKVDGHPKDKKYVLSNNEEVSIYISDNQLDDFINKGKIKSNDSIKNWIVYEDENVLIINKPRGVLVQPDSSNKKSLDIMVNEYLKFKGEINEDISFFTSGPVHRLDRNTSGLVVFGKNKEALQYLSKVFKNHELIQKQYIALVMGEISNDGVIEASLVKGSNNKVFVSGISQAKEAITKYQILKKYEGYTLVLVTLITGRTHQIRVHFSYINHPIVGDEKYGNFAVNKEFNDKYKLKNQFLHAYELCFLDLKEPLKYLRGRNFKAEMPKELTDILKDLKEII